jgi:hypothetical protein
MMRRVQARADLSIGSIEREPRRAEGTRGEASLKAKTQLLVAGNTFQAAEMIISEYRLFDSSTGTQRK